jgi:uncharacterized surface protein with fasciclin (FAS1) repeats
VKAAGLVDTLSGAGPFTVFAPTDTAFGKLPEGTVDNLLKPESGTAMLKTVSGKSILLKDEKRGMSMITQSNVFQSNGVIHVVDTVPMPN